MLETPALGTETTRKGLKLLSIGDPSTPLSTQVDTDAMDQAFLFHFCILQAIKNWTVGRPGNEARQYLSCAMCRQYSKCCANTLQSCFWKYFQPQKFPHPTIIKPSRFGACRLAQWKKQHCACGYCCMFWCLTIQIQQQYWFFEWYNNRMVGGWLHKDHSQNWWWGVPQACSVAIFTGHRNTLMLLLVAQT